MSFEVWSAIEIRQFCYNFIRKRKIRKNVKDNKTIYLTLRVPQRGLLSLQVGNQIEKISTVETFVNNGIELFIELVHLLAQTIITENVHQINTNIYERWYYNRQFVHYSLPLPPVDTDHQHPENAYKCKIGQTV